jgi:hypothetical protein
MINVSLGRKLVLVPETEIQLHEYCCNVNETFYGLTVEDFEGTAYH